MTTYLGLERDGREVLLTRSGRYLAGRMLGVDVMYA